MPKNDPEAYTESQLYIPALRVMSEQPNGYISTTDLIAELTNRLQPIGRDAEIIAGRHDTHFSQKVRNIKSHKGTPGNMIYEGYAEDVEDGFQITPKGLEYLERNG